MIHTILNNNDYLFQYISEGNDKLLIYIKSPPAEDDKKDTEKHNLDPNKIDIYCKTILSEGYDVIYIRNKNLANMYDEICDEAFIDISEISKTYKHVDGWFVCGGSVIGLYFSKLINYRNIYCISSRFIQRMTLDDKPDFKYANYRVTANSLNQDAKYIIFYNKYQINSHDSNTATWLRVNTDKNITYVYDNEKSNFHHQHLIEQQVYLKTYLKVFIPSILNDKILEIDGMNNEIFN